ncbi:hypothetical protein OIU78_019624 [Salix suchowensis]|nr:hypothetical protein OIU78_019624 [Salix suchowensis]
MGGGVVKAEMFGQLTSGLESAWNKLKGEEVLTKENIVEPMRDIRRALLEADVSIPVVRRVICEIKIIVHDELVKLMGGEVSELVFAKSAPTVILLAGLQGVGKTNVCAKLANYLKKQGKSCMLIAGDVCRPATIDQLVILGEQPVTGRCACLYIDKGMMDELNDVKRVLNPTEVLLVVDAMTGQEAAALVTTFNLEIGITGAILTKLDEDSRGGAALSVKEVCI